MFKKMMNPDRQVLHAEYGAPDAWPEKRPVQNRLDAGQSPVLCAAVLDTAAEPGQREQKKLLKMGVQPFLSNGNSHLKLLGAQN